MEHIGIDLHKQNSQICILTAEGELIETRIQTECASFKRLLGDRPPAQILIEASTESEWVALYLEELGHQVIVADPNFAPMYATRSKKIKTDLRDARTLCEACRLGAYRPAHRSSEVQRRIRAQLTVRETLVRTRAKYISLIRSLTRREGLRIRNGAARGFLDRVEQMEMPVWLRREIDPLMKVMKSLNEEIQQADERVAEIANQDQVVKRLCTVPGVGPVTAVSYAATIDNCHRFSGAKQVRSYLGLVPREHSSGERQCRGHITKVGHQRIRWLLVEAAWTILRKESAQSLVLYRWASKIAQRRGKRVAVVALARKLAGMLYAVWRDGTCYDQSKLNPRSRAEQLSPA